MDTLTEAQVGLEEPTAALDLGPAIAAALAVLPPAPPLTELAAVNPLAGLDHLSFADAVREAGRLFGADAYLPASAYRQAWHDGRITERDLLEALTAAGRSADDLEAVVAELESGSDLDRPARSAMTPAEWWDAEAGTAVRAEIDRRAGQWVGLALGLTAASVPSPVRRDGLWAAWWSAAVRDRSLPRQARRRLELLKGEPIVAAQEALVRLGVAPEQSAEVVLGEVTAQPGWAARLVWEAGHGRYPRDPEEALTELVAMRLGLTMALLPAGGSPRPAPVEARTSTDPRHIWQEALEAGPRRSLLAALPAPPEGPEHRDGRAPTPAAQIACCIDVRSEALRRHIEAIGDYETLGVAGFFGLPMAWRPLDGHGADASCPLVVAPAIEVGEAPLTGAVGAEVRARRGRTSGASGAGRRAAKGVASPYLFAEAAGWVTGPVAAARTFAPLWPAARSPTGARPSTTTSPSSCPALAVDERADMAEGVLRAIGLTTRFAPLVVLCGHGSTTTANPYEAALRCGACGGRDGTDNARTLVALLSDPDVRSALAGRGIEIPAGTSLRGSPPRHHDRRGHAGRRRAGPLRHREAGGRPRRGRRRGRRRAVGCPAGRRRRLHPGRPPPGLGLGRAHARVGPGREHGLRHRRPEPDPVAHPRPEGLPPLLRPGRRHRRLDPRRGVRRAGPGHPVDQRRLPLQRHGTGGVRLRQQGAAQPGRRRRGAVRPGRRPPPRPARAVGRRRRPGARAPPADVRGRRAARAGHRRPRRRTPHPHAGGQRLDGPRRPRRRRPVAALDRRRMGAGPERGRGGPMSGSSGPLGIVGGGQLAVMTAAAAVRLGVDVVVLASRLDDPAVRFLPDTVVGDPTDGPTLDAFVRRCGVATFDHELVDVAPARRPRAPGRSVAPRRLGRMAVATDKQAQRLRVRGGRPPPPRPRPHHHGRRRAGRGRGRLGWPVVAKVARGGYDGRGVAVLRDEADLAAWDPGHPLPAVVEPALDIEAELAVQVARRPGGEMVVYPVVRTVQVDGMCHSVVVPSGLPAGVEAEAVAIARAVAEAVDARRAARRRALRGRRAAARQRDRRSPPQHRPPHDRQLRDVAVREPPARRARPAPRRHRRYGVPAAAMANVVGRSSDHASDPRADPGPGVTVHLYGKPSRPGRKLGHVTAVPTTAAPPRPGAPVADALVGRAVSTRSNAMEVPVTVAVVMGSDSDLPVMGAAAEVLDRSASPTSCTASRPTATPHAMLAFADRAAAERRAGDRRRGRRCRPPAGDDRLGHRAPRDRRARGPPGHGWPRRAAVDRTDARRHPRGHDGRRRCRQRRAAGRPDPGRGRRAPAGRGWSSTGPSCAGPSPTRTPASPAWAPGAIPS